MSGRRAWMSGSSDHNGADALRIVQWFLVSETLPDDDVAVLVADDEGEVMEAYREDGHWILGAYPTERIMLAWAHLPEPPAWVMRAAACRSSMS